MNRFSTVILFLLGACIFSCQKVEELVPFEYPGMLANRIGQVSVLEDGTLIAIGVDGIFVRYPDNSTSVIPIDYSETDLTEAYSMKFLNGENVIYGVNAAYVLVIRKAAYQFYPSEYYTNGLLPYPQYTLTPDKELIMLTYGTSRYNQDLDNYENPVRISRWNSSGWDFADSEIYVPEVFSSIPPSLVFESNYRAYLWVNKLYEIGYNEYDDVDFEEIIPINGDISSNVIYSASLNNNEIVGFDRELNNSKSFMRSIIFNTTSGQLSGSSPSSSCGVEPFGSMSFDQFLGTDGAIANFYTESVYNSFSVDYKRGEIYTYNISDGTCSVDGVFATGPLREFDLSITDIAIDAQNELLYIGSNRGLYIYDQQNRTVESYLEKLKDENQE